MIYLLYNTTQISELTELIKSNHLQKLHNMATILMHNLMIPNDFGKDLFDCVSGYHRNLVVIISFFILQKSKWV